MSRRTIDFITGLSIDLEEEPRLHNLHALDFLPSGLFSLANTMRAQEQKAYDFYKNTLGLAMGPNVFMHQFGGVLGADNHLCTCIFHWFAVSLVNYLRLVGYLDYLDKTGLSHKEATEDSHKKYIKAHCDSYSRGVCPEIVIWRNKIGAHLAITSPYAQDNQGTLEMSAMCNLSYSNMKIISGAETWTTKGQAAELPSWSVCDVFEGLSGRYWPNYLLQKVEH